MDVWNELEHHLRQRRFEAPDENLAARIVAMAVGRPQQLPVHPLDWLWRLWEEFHLPRPALAMACILLLGIMVGLVLPGQTSSDRTQPVVSENASVNPIIRSVYYPEEEIL